ncbi:MAG TPA: hypothetical protein VFQ54_03770, partial [Thermomicrobiales bacterium]|nr:hypothetical protein [Thermomicrobiales bacterium]
MRSMRQLLPVIRLPFLLRPLAALALAFLLVGPGLTSAPPAAAQPHKLKVVASFSILGDWIQ